MNYVEAVMLGLLQGLTEFLPVSSSGHLVIAQHFLGIKQPGVTFEVMVHFGTLLSIIWVFRKDLLSLVRGFRSKMEERKLLTLLIMGIIPTGLMGIILKSFFVELYDKPFVVGLMLLVTGFIVLAISKVSIKYKDITKMSYGDALIIGFFQGIAIIPGISRSGSTIFGALLRGLNRETAVRYSFLLALPAIAGATVLELKELFEFGGGRELFAMNVAAMFTSFISGILAITVFINLLKRGKFYYIAYYCWGVGILTVLLSFLFSF